MALLLKYGTLKPISPKEADLICVKCLIARAKWITSSGEDDLSWCAHCFLYETDWGKNNAEQRDGLVSAVEKDLNKKLTDMNGVLLPNESDRILSAVVMVSAYVNGKAVSKDEGDGT